MGTRRHRLLTGRMAAVAMVLGVLPAALSGPVGAVLLDWVYTEPTVHEYTAWRADGHLVIFMRMEFPTATILVAESEPEPASQDHIDRATRPETRQADSDPRPRRVRAPLDGFYRSRVYGATGWPFDAACWRGSINAMQRPRFVGQWEPTVFGHDMVVPVLPAWPGLAANTVFYGTIVLAVMVLLRWRRTRRRRARGLCVACGYDLGQRITTCPECGLERGL